MQLVMQPVRTQPFEAVEGEAIRRYAKRDLRGCRLDETSVGSDDGNARRPVFHANAIIDAFDLMFKQR